MSLRFLFSFSFGLTSSDIVEGLSVFVSELEQRRCLLICEHLVEATQSLGLLLALRTDYP